MPRLPHPGQDAGQWGTILNDYLSQAHNDDGTLKPITEDTLASSVQTKLNTIPSPDGQNGKVLGVASDTYTLIDAVNGGGPNNLRQYDVPIRYVDHIGPATDGIATRTAKTPETIPVRDAHGRIKAADGAESDDLVTMGQLDMLAGQLSGLTATWHSVTTPEWSGETWNVYGDSGFWLVRNSDGEPMSIHGTLKVVAGFESRLPLPDQIDFLVDPDLGESNVRFSGGNAIAEYDVRGGYATLTLNSPGAGYVNLEWPQMTSRSLNTNTNLWYVASLEHDDFGPYGEISFGGGRLL